LQVSNRIAGRAAKILLLKIIGQLYEGGISHFTIENDGGSGCFVLNHSGLIYQTGFRLRQPLPVARYPWLDRL